jgi:hypothetical protein
MKRVADVVKLLMTNEDLKPTRLFSPSDGARGEILRFVVVFLHSSLEVLLRSRLPKPNRSYSFYSASDLEKVLRLSGIDAKPFRALYPPLTQMAKRRNRIVHDADLINGDVETWGIADDWQLIMWNLAVIAFYYQFWVALDETSALAISRCEAIREAMEGHVKFGNQLLAFPELPTDSRIAGLMEMRDTMLKVSAILQIDAEEIAKLMNDAQSE